MLLSFEDVGFAYGEDEIFRGVTFKINEGERAGLIGENGAGKTTLLKLALGFLAPDSGRITLKNGIKTGYLAQNGGYVSGNTVYGEMLSVFSEDLMDIERLEKLSHGISEAADGSEYRRLAARFESVTDRINARESYGADVKIKTVLNGMGFSGMYDRVIDTMSGGEKTRLKLARLLLEEPDILILDEPTNHLDISTLFWLEDYLSTRKCALLVVSHDRYFLDKLCTDILELENGALSAFRGNYTKYKLLKAEKQARLLKEYEAYEEEAAKLKDYIDRNIVRATTARSAQSRVKKLGKLEAPEKPYTPPRPPEFRFGDMTTPAEKAVVVSGLDLFAGGKLLVRSVNLCVARGKKVALVGENGAGKTTLLKAVFSGCAGVEKGRGVKMALYDQEGLDLDPENTVLAELWQRHAAATQTEMRALLARSGLFEEDMFKKVRSLSGGERAKLALCVLQAENADFLLLDEPTNHLDLPARESLERALKDFGGTVLFVSHDRYFISAVADEVVEIEDGKLNTYCGNYDFYVSEKSARAQEEARLAQEEKNAEFLKKREQSHKNRAVRAAEAAKKEKMRETERSITLLEEEENALTLSLSDPDVAADYKKVKEISARLAEIKKSLDDLYNAYSDMI